VDTKIFWLKWASAQDVGLFGLKPAKYRVFQIPQLKLGAHQLDLEFNRTLMMYFEYSKLFLKRVGSIK